MDHAESMRGGERFDHRLADRGGDRQRELAALLAARARCGDQILDRDVATAAARDDDDIGAARLDTHGRHDVRVLEPEDLCGRLGIGQRDAERALREHLRVDDEPAQVALAVELGAMDRAVHRDRESLA